MSLTLAKQWGADAILYMYKGHIHALRRYLNWLGRVITKPLYWA